MPTAIGAWRRANLRMIRRAIPMPLQLHKATSRESLLTLFSVAYDETVGYHGGF
jgi:hypothetical protein